MNYQVSQQKWVTLQFHSLQKNEHWKEEIWFSAEADQQLVIINFQKVRVMFVRLTRGHYCVKHF